MSSEAKAAIRGTATAVVVTKEQRLEEERQTRALESTDPEGAGETAQKEAL